MRDIEKNPYSPDERRVAHYFAELGVGGGDDPIGFMITSYRWVIHQRNIYKRALDLLSRDMTDSTARMGRIIEEAQNDF